MLRRLPTVACQALTAREHQPSGSDACGTSGNTSYAHYITFTCQNDAVAAARGCHAASPLKLSSSRLSRARSARVKVVCLLSVRSDTADVRLGDEKAVNPIELES